MTRKISLLCALASFMAAASAAPLTDRILKPVEAVAKAMEPGASDAQFLNPAGIPTYGITGLFQEPDLGNILGLNERARVQSVYDSREFLYRRVKLYANR